MPTPSRIRQAEVLLAAFDWDVDHCRQVRDLSISLFDQLQPLHQLDGDARDLLNAAALLHDIGWTVSHSKHHKHSYRLIHESTRGLSGFTLRQVELIANIARYHRKALPSLDHEPYAALSAAEREIVRHLAALLRLADGLDRPHLQQVRRVQVEITNGTVRLAIDVVADPAAHIDGAARKRELFESVSKRRLEITAVASASKGV